MHDQVLRKLHRFHLMKIFLNRWRLFLFYCKWWQNDSFCYFLNILGLYCKRTLKVKDSKGILAILALNLCHFSEVIDRFVSLPVSPWSTKMQHSVCDCHGRNNTFVKGVITDFWSICERKNMQLNPVPLHTGVPS